MVILNGIKTNHMIANLQNIIEEARDILRRSLLDITVDNWKDDASSFVKKTDDASFFVKKTESIVIK